MKVTVAAWGNFESKRFYLRTMATRRIACAKSTHVFGLTAQKEPKHPLYLPNSSRIIPWSTARTAV
jgi:hypothetical protein